MQLYIFKKEVGLNGKEHKKKIFSQYLKQAPM